MNENGKTATEPTRQAAMLVGIASVNTLPAHHSREVETFRFVH